VAELQATKGIGPDETTIKKSRLKELLGCEKLLEKAVL
jgi:hypothetical protein